MPSVTPYLTFPGTCEEAMDFYADALNGEIISMQHFGDAPDQNFPADAADRVLHCILVADDVIIMASDTMPGMSVTSGSNISMSLDFESAEEQQAAFNALAEGGTITMELQDTFWGAKFGMLTDKYGIAWMFNYDEDVDDDDEDDEEGDED